MVCMGVQLDEGRTCLIVGFKVKWLMIWLLPGTSVQVDYCSVLSQDQ